MCHHRHRIYLQIQHHNKMHKISEYFLQQKVYQLMTCCIFCKQNKPEMIQMKDDVNISKFVNMCLKLIFTKMKALKSKRGFISKKRISIKNEYLLCIHISCKKNISRQMDSSLSMCYIFCKQNKPEIKS